MVSCPGCGSGMHFDPAKQMLLCDHCGTTLEPGATGYQQEASTQSREFSGTLYSCPQCGGELFTDSDTAVTFCSYCGASVVLESRTVRMQAPSGIIPFKLTKESASQKYKSFIKKALFAPKYMQEEAQVEKLRGIYMPYWIYEFEYTGPMSFVGTKSYRRGSYDITDTYNLNTNVQLYYKGVSYDASSSFSDVYSEAIAPFGIRECKEFSTDYMCGFYADTADVYGSVYEGMAKEMVGSDVVSTLMRTNNIYSQYNVSMADNAVPRMLSTRSEQVAYFPVWFLANRHQGYVSYAVINGQTGKVAADVPIDYGKYLIGSLLLAIPIWLILSLIFTPTPFVLNILSLIFAVISMLIINKQMNILYTRNNGYDDLGLMSVRGMSAPGQAQQQKVKVKVTNPVASIGTMLIFGGYICFPLSSAADVPLFAMLGFILIASGFITVFVGGSNKSKNKAIARTKQVIVSMPLKEKMSVLIKPIIAMVISAIVMVVNPFIDYIYYGVVLVSMVIVIISIYDIVSIHNKLTRRLPRQFNKRGGDENCEI